MKSDREFINGIYAKAKKMEMKEEKEPDRVKIKRKTPVHYALTAAALLILLSVNYLFSNIPGAKEPITPQNISIEPRGLGIPDDIQGLLDTATEIVFIKSDENRTEGFQILKLYQHSLQKSIIAENLTKLLPALQENQTAIVFLKADTAGLQLLDMFTGKDGTKDYVNSKGEILTKERLDESLGN